MTEAGLRRVIVVLALLPVAAGCGTGADDHSLAAQIEAVRSGRTDRIDVGGSPAIALDQIDVLPTLKNLRWLRLDGTPVSSNDLRHISAIPGLETLFLSETRISDDGLKQLAGAQSLRKLVLDTTPVTDAGLKHLAQLPHLKSLSLWNCFITDRGCETLVTFPSLSNLSLDGTQITDAGFRQFRRAKSLHRISVWQTQVSPGAVTRLKKHRPRLIVNR